MGLHANEPSWGLSQNTASMACTWGGEEGLCISCSVTHNENLGLTIFDIVTTKKLLTQ